MRQLHENKSIKPEDAKEKTIRDATDKKLIEIMGDQKFKYLEKNQENRIGHNIQIRSNFKKNYFSVYFQVHANNNY
jgi:hypothetical protein